MCTELYCYVGYIYVLRLIFMAILQSCFSYFTTEESEMWADAAITMYLNFHYLLSCVFMKDQGDRNSVAGLTFVTILIVDLISVINTFGNREAIDSQQLEYWIYFMIVANLSAVYPLYLLVYKQEDEVDFDLARANDQSIVRNNGFMQDNRPIDREYIDKINYLLYQPYYGLRNKNCTICIVDFEPNDAVSVLPICHHIFHVVSKPMLLKF
ncbi:unnamed protein product [Moneuplotes crassus]|uniref:RING-type domain-containing protein n=1 Tax=Euplotes crassus TaxID=5936 RepID=A0AAD2D1T5_EUPCR|nr:unnamed protein product [Moneuplotes crassus]